MKKLSHELKEHGFSRKARIALNPTTKVPMFAFLPSSYNDDCRGIVYLWIAEEKGKPKEIWYIGSTEETLRTRCKKHENAFQKKGAGKNLAEQLSTLLKSGKKLSLYSRESDKVMTFIGICGPIHKLEEDSLIKFYSGSHPLLNKHGKNFKIKSSDLTPESLFRVDKNKILL